MVRGRTGFYILQGCKGQRLDVSMVGREVMRKYQLLICTSRLEDCTQSHLTITSRH